MESGRECGFEMGSAQVSEACGGALAASNLEAEVRMLLRVQGDNEAPLEIAPSVHVRDGVEYNRPW